MLTNHQGEIEGEDQHDEVMMNLDDGGTSALPQHQHSSPNYSHHSYLPGASHSLFVSQDILLHRWVVTDHTTTTLPVLQLPGVVVFPGNTLPLRLVHRQWAQYVRQLIEVGKEVRIGIFTHIPTRVQSHRQRSSWTRRASRLHVIDQRLLVNDDEPPIPLNENGIRRDSSIERDPLLGRVGTIVTVTYTHGDEEVVDEYDELIVTALGTRRCRIVGGVADQDGRYHNDDDLVGLKFYQIQEIFEDELKRPPIQRPMCSQSSSLQRQDGIMASLSMMTAIPSFCYRMVWPWRLVDQIKSVLLRMPWNLNPPSDEPMAFSFYMASNMALSEHDKLYILKTGGTVERLRYIYDKVVEQERQQTYVLCKLCSTKLSSATDMFTVAGSEGTSGAYVNEYGVIHQTITLRAVSEQHLWYTGGKETKDSWFPGYSWTIAYCRFCHSHLGWKFERVMGEDLLTADQLELFWGLSAASVTMRVIIP